MLKDKDFYIVGKLIDGDFEKRYIEPVKEKFIDSGFKLDEKNPSLVVAIGGDGTLLRAARMYPDANLVGIRAESRGGSFQKDFEDLDEVVKRISKEDYEIIEMPRAEMNYKDLKVWGLNEVYFIRNTSKFPGADRFKVFKNGVDQYSDEIYADGCLFATPFGSSAYNWSCRGPIIKNGFVLTPMVACYLNKNVEVEGEILAKHVEPLVLKEDEEILVEIERDANNVIYGDNEIVVDDVLFKKGDEIIFRKADSYTKMIRF